MMHTLASEPGLFFKSQEWLQRLVFRTRPGSETALASDALFFMIFWFSTAFFVVLMTLMVYWTIKYRRRPGVPVPLSPHHHTPLEILWTVIPSSALLVIFLLGFWGYMAKMVPAAGALELRVYASRWNWSVAYPSGVQSTETQPLSENDISFPIFYVPENTPVSLRMSSQDVIHAFWIPDFRTKLDVYPNRFTGYVFHTPVLGDAETVTDNSGETPVQIPGRDMWVFCAEYCGDDHSRMAATLRVVPMEIYQAKLASFESTGDPVKDGQLIHASRCATCHSVDGSANTGPTWLNLFGSQGVLSDGSTVIKDANYIRESIYEPQAKVLAGFPASMPSFQGQLTETQLDAVIAYMKTLSDRGGSQDPDAQNPEPQTPETQTPEPETPEAGAPESQSVPPTDKNNGGEP